MSMRKSGFDRDGVGRLTNSTTPVRALDRSDRASKHGSGHDPEFSSEDVDGADRGPPAPAGRRVREARGSAVGGLSATAGQRPPSPSVPSHRRVPPARAWSVTNSAECDNRGPDGLITRHPTCQRLTYVSAVPDEIITELPRIRVERERGLPVSGAAHWNGRCWVITVSADEHPLRQRFSLAHEFKHVLDHTTEHFFYIDRPTVTAHEQAERVADYFAACLLMPKRVVKRLWGEQHQDVGHLADMLRVSPAALQYRLDQLGLTERRARCDSSRHLATRRAVARARSLRPALAGDRR